MDEFGTRVPHLRAKFSDRLILSACAVTLVLCSLYPGCYDRLPTDWAPPQSKTDSLSDNAFILDGDAYRQQAFNFTSQSARAYYFPIDTMTNVWNTDSIFGPGGKRIPVIAHIHFPGDTNGVFLWENGIANPGAKSKVRIIIDSEEWVSLDGRTKVEVLQETSSTRISGTYEGVVQHKDGRRIILSQGRFRGVYF